MWNLNFKSSWDLNFCGTSLNDKLLIGPDLFSNLVGILVRYIEPGGKEKQILLFFISVVQNKMIWWNCMMICFFYIPVMVERNLVPKGLVFILMRIWWESNELDLLDKSLVTYTASIFTFWVLHSKVWRRVVIWKNWFGYSDGDLYLNVIVRRD